MRSINRIRATLGGTVLAVACAAVLAGCGGRAERDAATRILNVTEKDFTIAAPKSVRAGNLLIRAHNKGPDDHELIFVRLDGKKLPLRQDGITVAEDALEKAEAGALEPFSGRTVGELRVHLTPGRYELLCNMAGHYLGGMHRVLRVDA